MVSVGQQIGSYKIVRALGEGGMGAVFEGVNEAIARHAAIKVLHAEIAANPQVAQRFFNEARAVNIINHPGIVQIFEFGHTPDGTAYIVMEMLGGESLAGRIRRVGKLGPDALRLGRQVASALAAAHAKGIIHRDLKPDNVMIVEDSEAPGGERCKVLDFGIAKIHDAHRGTDGGALRTSTHAVMGTPAYMAPEQCTGAAAVDDKADVYALGIMLFQMLSGRIPFEAPNSVALMYQHISAPPPPLETFEPTVPLELAGLVRSMLAKQPAERPSMAEVVAALERFGAPASKPGVSKPGLGAPGMAMGMATGMASRPGAMSATPSTLGHAAGQMVAAGSAGAPGVEAGYASTHGTSHAHAMSHAQVHAKSQVGASPKKGIGGGTVAIIVVAVLLVVGLVGGLTWRMMMGAGEVIENVASLADDEAKGTAAAAYDDPKGEPKDEPEPVAPKSGRRVRASAAAAATATTDEGEGGGSGVTLGGVCGRFSDMAVTAPPGFAIMACNDDGGGTATLVLTGSGDPRAACRVLKQWASGAGYSLENQAAMGAMMSYILKRDGERLVLACNRVTDRTMLTVSVTSE